MKKIIFPLYSIVSLSIVSVLSLLWVIADRIIGNETYLYTGSSAFTIYDLRVLAVFVVITLLVSAIVAFLFKNVKKKWLRIIITIIIVLISMLSLLQVIIGILAFAPRAYVELVSDDGTHHIVIEEDCYLFSIYGGDIFEKTSSHTMKKLVKYETDIDFYTPFSDGNYFVIWHEENFELFYDSDGNGEIDEKILIEYLH